MVADGIIKEIGSVRITVPHKVNGNNAVIHCKLVEQPAEGVQGLPCRMNQDQRLALAAFHIMNSCRFIACFDNMHRVAQAHRFRIGKFAVFDCIFKLCTRRFKAVFGISELFNSSIVCILCGRNVLVRIANYNIRRIKIGTL